MSDEKRKPSATDYMAAAALAYGIVYFWLRLKMVVETPSLLAYLIYYLAGLAPSYLVCRRTDSAHLAVGIKSAFASWVFTVVTLLAFVEPLLAFFGILLICLVLGGATASYLALKQSLS